MLHMHTRTCMCGALCDLLASPFGGLKLSDLFGRREQVLTLQAPHALGNIFF